ncbi:MAG: hypothetical protein F4Z66_05530, partial [Gammaproteobacteria bacterium]|nr:hypothetical protein [Gammaproteobacteria bacterium]
MRREKRNLICIIDSIRTTITIANLEVRNLVKTVALWILYLITTIFIIFNYLDITIKYSVTEIISPLNGIVNTEYIKISFITQTFVMVAPILLSILIGKIRVNAIRDQIKPVIDSKPISNFQLLHGHALGVITLLITFYIVSISLIIIFSTVLTLISALNFNIGAGVEFFVALIIFDVFPILAFWTGIVTILNTTISSRTINALIVATLSISTYYFAYQAPMTLAAHLGHVGMLLSSLPSSISNNELDIGLITSRIGLIGLAYFLIFISATMLKRKDFVRRLVRAFGYMMVGTIAIQFIVWPIIIKGFDVAQQERWKMHQEKFAEGKDSDLLEVSGAIKIVPGDNLHLDITMKIQLTSSDTNDNIVFSFNPGMHIHSLKVNGNAQAYRFDDGLLSVPIKRDFVSGEYLTLHLIASGIPNADFGYLDEIVDLQNSWNTNNVFTRSLGYRTLSYNKRFVALPYASRWLPTLTNSTTIDQDIAIGTDFFNVDISVSIPRNWTIAAPHRDFLESKQQSIHYRIAPDVPISNITLIASEFTKFGWRIDGVNVELLL